MFKKSTVNLNSNVYYKGNYWNDIKMVREYMSENFTDDPNKWWVQHFAETYANKPFSHALFVNCGDGRFEREFIDRKIVKQITAFDISPELIARAKKGKGRRRIKYLVADANTINFPPNSFDLVVNIAALHHTQYINRMCRLLAKCLKREGIYVGFDYIGPHRNQYPLVQWMLAKMVNRSLPAKVRKTMMGYPHIPTMLATDPTEAIHSELILKFLNRYFNILHHRGTGGGIAYEILTHNDKLNKLKNTQIESHVNKILKYDRFFTNIKLTPDLFAYTVAAPNKIVLKDKSKLSKWQKSEDLREKTAANMRGVYRFVDYMRIVYHNKNNKDRLYLVAQYIKSLPLIVKQKLIF